MSKPTEIEKAEAELAKLEDIEVTNCPIIGNDEVIVRNNKIEDKDGSITAIKRIEESVEKAINEAFKFATDSDNPKGYDSMAKLVKEYGNLQKIKMDIHHGAGNLDGVKPTGEDEQPDGSQTIPTSIQDILDRVKQAKLEKEQIENPE